VKVFATHNLLSGIVIEIISGEHSARGYNWTTLFLGGYKYRNLTLQVGGVSDETIKYGREFCGTLTQE
jgi:hypothetical protein